MSKSTEFAGSGIAGLDEVLGGGYPRGQFSLIRGSSGAGKTTLGLQFLIEGARQGEAVLYLGTSETEREIRHVAQSHGWSLDGVSLHHHEHPPVYTEQTMLHPAEVELPETMESLLSVVRDVSPSRLVIDSLAEFRVLARDELWYRRQLMTLKQYFVDDDCTVLLIEVPNKDQPVLDSIVSGVVELERIVPLYGPDRRQLRVSKIRGQPFSMGRHDYKIVTGGLQVFPRLTCPDDPQPLTGEQISTGMPAMDAMFEGGLSRGTSTLLLGPSGTGKSLVAAQLATAAAERGERCAFFIFDERIQTLFGRAAGVGLAFQQHVEAGTIQVRQVDPAELTSGEFSHIVRTLVEDDGIQMLIIDSLNGYAYAMPEEQSLSVHLHELTSYLNHKAVTPVFTLTQHGLIANQGGQPFDISYIADTVILFRHFEFAGRIHKAVSVYKCRSGPHETAIRELQISSDGMQLGEPLRQFRGILTGVPDFTGEVLNGDERHDESKFANR